MRGVCPLHGDMAPPTEQDLPVQKFLSEALAASVTLSANGTWYNGPSFLLPPGLWLVSFHVTFSRTATTLAQYMARVWNGSTVYASGMASHPSQNPHYVQMAMSTVVSVQASTTLTGQGRTSAGSSTSLMRTTIGSGEAGATVLTAVKL